MTTQIFKPSEIEMNGIGFTEPKVMASGGKNLYLNYNRSKLVIQVPKMSMPYNMNCYKGPSGDQPPKYNINLSFKNKNSDSNVNDFYKFLENLDRKMIESGKENSLSWLSKKNLSNDVVEALYKPLLRHSKDKNTGEPDGKWPSTFEVKIPHYEGKFTCEVYDTDKKLVPSDKLEEYLVKGSEVSSLIQCTSVWIAGGKFGCSWKIIQMKVEPPKNPLKGYAFLDSDSDDEPVNKSVSASNVVNDSDDSDSEIDVSDSDEQEPSQVPIKKSKSKVKTK